MNRALRRHHDQRIKQKVKSYHSGVHKDDPRNIGIIARTRQLCSALCCGNPRRHKKMVIGETVYDQDGNKSVIHKVHTLSKKDRLTNQEKIHDLSFELKGQ